MNIYHQAALQRRIEELEVENVRLRSLLKTQTHSEEIVVGVPCLSSNRGYPLLLTSEEAKARQEFLDNVKPLGYTSARAYIEAMADKYGVDVENARQAFLNCGYEDWNTGFIETLMEMDKGE